MEDANPKLTREPATPCPSSSLDLDDDDMVDSHIPDSGTSVSSTEAMSVASTSPPIEKTAADDEMELVDIETCDLQAGDSNAPAIQPPQDRLSSLPTELKDLVFKDLDLLDKLDLRLTNRHFFNYIPAYTHADFLKAEQLERAVARKFYTCSMCVRLRPKAKFADKSRKNGKGRAGKRAAWRFCLDCGLRQNYNGHAKLPSNTWVTIDKITHVVCYQCGRLAKAHKGHGTSFCQDCWLNDVQPRLEAHANPVVPKPATVADMHRMGETWISNYSTPYDVVQSAIRVGISAPSTLATHRKWDMNGKKLVADGKPDAEEKDLTWKQVSKDQDPTYKKPAAKITGAQEKGLTWKQTSMDQGFTYKKAFTKIACGRSGRAFYFRQKFANRSTVPHQEQQKVLGPAAAFNRPVTRAYKPNNKNEANSKAYPESVPTSADIEVGAAGPGPSTLLNTAKPQSSSGRVFSAEMKQRLAISDSQDNADMEMKAGCAIKISLPVRSFSTKPAPPKCEVSGNSGNIITRNYFKASQALRNKDPKGRLGWYTTTKTQALTTAADLRDLREKDLTTFQIQSIHPRKRKARDISTLDAAIHDGTPTSHSLKRKRRIELDSEEEWNGFSDYTSSLPESSNGGDVEELRAKALATIPAHSVASKKRRNRGPEPSVAPIRPDSLAPCKREKRRRIDESSEEEWEGFHDSKQPSPEHVTQTRLDGLRAKAPASQGSKSKESTTGSKQHKAHNTPKAADSESVVDDDEWEGFPDDFKQPSSEPYTRKTLEELRAKALATQGSNSKQPTTLSKQRKASNASKPTTPGVSDDDEWEGLPDSRPPSPEPFEPTTPEKLRIKALATQGSNTPHPPSNPKKRKANAPPATAASYKSAWPHLHIPLVENIQKKRRVEEDSDDSFEGFGPDLGELEPAFEGFDTSDTELSSGSRTEAVTDQDKKEVLRARALATLKIKGKKV